MHYLMFYELAPDYLQRREAFRAEHLALAWAASANGQFILGGALADPVDTAVLLFQGDSANVAEEFAATRAKFRWRQLVALARVTASEYGRPAPGVAEAKELLKV